MWVRKMAITIVNYSTTVPTNLNPFATRVKKMPQARGHVPPYDPSQILPQKPFQTPYLTPTLTLTLSFLSQ